MHVAAADTIAQCQLHVSYMLVTVSCMSARALDAVLEEFLMFTMPVFILMGVGVSPDTITDRPPCSEEGEF